jgi:hypothetical protein
MANRSNYLANKGNYLANKKAFGKQIETFAIPTKYYGKLFDYIWLTVWEFDKLFGRSVWQTIYALQIHTFCMRLIYESYMSIPLIHCMRVIHEGV